jgi:hypothetical protein
MSCSGHKMSAAREQRRIEHFGESNLEGVIGRQIVPQFPHARQHPMMRIPVQRKSREIGEGGALPPSISPFAA